MKKKLLSILVLCTALTFFGCPSDKTEETSRFTTVEDFGLDGTLLSSETYKYNDDGNIIQHTSLNPDGSAVEYVVFEYGSTGNLIKELCYLADDTCTTYIDYEYAEENLSKETRCDGQTGEVEYISNYQYNDTGDLVRKEYCNANGDVEWFIEYYYDTLGKLIYKEFWFGDIDSETPGTQYAVLMHFFYEYDADFNCVAVHYYFLYFTGTQTFEYNGDGKLVKTSLYMSMGEPIIMLSTAELDLVSYYSFAYDHDGRLVSVEEYYSESPSQPENEFVKERHWTIKWEDGMCLENVLNWIDWMNFGEDDPLGPIFPLFDSQRQNG